MSRVKKKKRKLEMFKGKIYSRILKEDIEDAEIFFTIEEALEFVKEAFGLIEVTIYFPNKITQEYTVKVSTNKAANYPPISMSAIPLKEQFIIREVNDLFEIDMINRVNEDEVFSRSVMKKKLDYPSHKMLSQLEKTFERLFVIFNIFVTEKRYKHLERVVDTFHSSMKVDDVLANVIARLKEIYPTYEHHLLLTYDSKNDNNLPIKSLIFENGNGHFPAMHAYVSGKIYIEDVIKERKTFVYAPIKGTQGVYGVLEMKTPFSQVFSESELRFISLLAATTGSALENAKLYEQSHSLIEDLQLINETMHLLNGHQTVKDMVTCVIEQIRKSFSIDAIGFIMKEDDRTLSVLNESTDLFHTEECVEYTEFALERIKKEEKSFLIGNLDKEQDKPHTYLSLMVIPMMHSSVMKGFALILHKEAYKFSFDMFRLLQSLVQHSTLAIMNAFLHEELQEVAITDHLTKLFSRRYLDEKITQSVCQEECGVFILLDIDNFKQVNDTYGHLIGDDIIVQVANQMRKCAGKQDIVARWGGEEFAMYLPNVALDKGLEIANQLLHNVREHTNPNVTISCGLSYWQSDQLETVRALFNRADAGLYTAKKSGKNRAIVQTY